MNENMDKVELYTKTLGALFNKCEVEIIKEMNRPLFGELSIPSYQRIYCWQEKQVYKLLDDIINYAKKPYHMGSVILHKNKDGVLDIVDGQQRLVTLTLLLHALGKETLLLNAVFESNEAQKYIAYNKYIIEQYCNTNKKDFNVLFILNNLIFSVLIIESECLDLAYTFFSNQNSRGKTLTDYDLLKAHHLRFVHIEAQAMHLAERWDNLLIVSNDEDGDKNINRTLGTHLFRLRKWMRKREWNDEEKFKVKTEFEAALTIEDIPPFGEQFKFNESIQGGTHFFAFAEHFVFQYKVFSNTKECKTLSNNLKGETHFWYNDVIEALLYAYFLKFGTIYLSEALMCIEKIISHHRYSLSRSSLRKLFEYAGNTEIIMMIDQATSPTFFLAESLEKIKKMPSPPNDIKGIRQRYSGLVKRIIEDIGKDIVIEKFRTI